MHQLRSLQIYFILMHVGRNRSFPNINNLYNTRNFEYEIDYFFYKIDCSKESVQSLITSTLFIENRFFHGFLPVVANPIKLVVFIQMRMISNVLILNFFYPSLVYIEQPHFSLQISQKSLPLRQKSVATGIN